MGEDQSRVLVPCGKDAPVERGEVLDVLGDDRSPIGCCGPQQILIGQPAQVGPLLDCDGVVAAVSQPARDGDGVVAAVSLPSGRDASVEHREVLHILGDYRSAIGRRCPKQILVRQPDEVGTILDSDSVVSSAPQMGRDTRGVHLVEEELHPDSSLRSFSQAANSRSAMWSLRAISASISSVNSA